MRVHISILILFSIFILPLNINAADFYKDVINISNINESDYLPWLKIGNSFLSTGNYSASLEAYNKSINLNPKSAEAWFGKGKALNYLNKNYEALQAYEIAIRLDPENESAWYERDLIISSIPVEQCPDYIECYRSPIQNPTIFNRLFQSGNRYYDEGSYDLAIKSYDEAIKINPYSSDAFYNKGNAFYRLGNYEEALKAYETAIDIEPRFADAWENKGIMLEKLGHPEEGNLARFMADMLREN